MLEILEEMGNMPAKPVISLIGAGGKTTWSLPGNWQNRESGYF